MGYIILFVAIVGLITYLDQRRRSNSIKRNGIKTTGIIIQNSESGETDNRSDMYRLGGNINEPTIQFTTLDGQVIIGKPIIGFITQYELAVPKEVNIVYNSKNPQEFYIDLE